MTALECINRIFRSNGIVKGDDDAISSFSDTAHNATIQLAIIAIQDELNDLLADSVVAYEVTSGSITTVAGTRTYALEADFIRFYGTPKFYYPVGNRPIFEWTGGRESLSDAMWTYQTALGEPHHWYFEPTTTKKVGFYQVPNGVYTYTYDYERSIDIDEAGDVLPFHNTQEDQAFSQLAGRRFKALFEGNSDVVKYIKNDPSYTSAKSTLMGLMKGRKPYGRYGTYYR